MNEQELLFNEIGEQVDGATKGQLFGKACFKMGKKAFCCFFENCMVFKLPQPAHAEALNLEGAELFDPSGKGRPMKEWVQIPYNSSKKWLHYANISAHYVSK